MERNEIKKIINSYVSFSVQKPEYKQAVANLIKNEPEATEFIITELSNDQFWRFVRNFDLPKDVVQKRTQCELDILKNSENYSLNVVQNALADLWFKMNPDSFSLRLKTISERASYSADYKSIYSKYEEYLRRVDEFLHLKEGEVPRRKVGETVKKLIDESKKITKNKTNFDIFSGLYRQAQDSFRSELDSRLRSSQEKMFKGIEPEIIKSSKGKPIKVYKMQNQTRNQSHFEVLIHSASEFALRDEEAQKQYFEKAQNYPYTSYSLFTESLNRQFLKNGVIFGYSTTGGAEMMSCTTRDGQTNQTYLDTGRYVMRQQYLPVDEFVERTGKYNEIVLRRSKKIQPSMIICTEYPPNDLSISMAERFDIPIVFIDKTAYKEHSREGEQLEWYENKGYLDTPLSLDGERTSEK